MVLLCLWCLFSTLHGHLASEHTQLKEKLEAVAQDNIQLVREHNHVKLACEELRRLHDDDQREVADMRMLHQQVPVLLMLPSMFMIICLQTRAQQKHRLWTVMSIFSCP